MFSNSNQVGIGIALTLHDGATQGLTNAAKAFQHFSSTANSIATNFIGMGNSILNTTENMGRAGVGFLRKSVEEAMSFEYTMKSVGVIIGATAKEIAMLSKVASDTALTTIFDPKETALAMEVLAKAGQTALQIKDSLKPIAYLAAATDTPINRTASYVNDIMAGYAISSKEATKVVDLISSAVNFSNISFENLYQTFRHVAYNGKLLNLSLEETLAIVGALGNAGLKGSIAGTSLNNFLTNLSKAIGKYAVTRQVSVLKDIGLSPGDVVNSKGELKNLVEIAEIFAKKITKLTKVQQVAALDALFQKRGGKMMVVMKDLMPVLNGLSDDKVGRNAKQIHELLKGPTTAGYAKRVADTKQWETAAGNLEAMKSALQDLYITVGNTILPWVTKGFKGLRAVITQIHHISQSWVGKVLIGSVAVVSPLLIVFSRLSKMVMNMGFAWGMMTGNMGMFSKGILGIMKVAGLGNILSGGIPGPTNGKRGRGNPYLKFGFQTRAAYMAAQASPIANVIGSVVGGFGRLGPLLGRLVTSMMGPIGILATVVIATGNFGNVIKTLGLVLLEAVNVISTIVDIIKWPFGGENPMTGWHRRHQRNMGFLGFKSTDYRTPQEQGRARFEERMEKLRKSKSDMSVQQEKLADMRKQSNSSLDNKSLLEVLKQQYGQFYNTRPLSNVTINVDGKKKVEEDLMLNMDKVILTNS